MRLRPVAIALAFTTVIVAGCRSAPPILDDVPTTEAAAMLFFDSSEPPGVVPPAATPERNRRFVGVNLAPLESTNNQRVSVALFDGRELDVEGTRFVRAGAGFVWLGKVRNQPTSLVVLSVQGNALSGNILTDGGESFEIGPAGNTVHYLRQLERSSATDDVNSGPSLLSLAEPDPRQEPCGGTETGHVIEILVGYTKTARMATGSRAAMEARIYGAVEATNESFRYSGIQQRIEVVHLEEVDYAESTDACTHVTRMQKDLDGELDRLIERRNDHGADLVVLVMDNALQSKSTFDANGRRTGCAGSARSVNGEAFGILNPVLSTWHPNAFALVQSSLVTTELAFAHELGHLMGARHEITADGTTTPFPFGHGFYSVPCARRSVMATNGCCPRTAYWSNTNPRFTPCQIDFGTANVADNAEALEQTAKTVASFRCSSPLRNDVWMRDTWHDTGQEPEPATATEVMWASPYIWVRRSEDVARIHQHQHETPPLNTPVFAYVKVHNAGATAAAGALELYHANASTTLSFPDGAWKPIGTIAVSGTDLPAQTTRVFQFPWTTPASTPLGAGRFTYLARWVSATDPIAVPSADVETITRGTNNVVWRSDEVAGGENAPPHASFVVRNRPVPPGVPGTPMTIAITPAPEEINGSVFFFARAVVSMSDNVAAAWRAGGRKGRGFRELPDGRLLVTAPQGITLDDVVLSSEGTVRVDFQRTPDTPRRDFRIEALQIAEGRRLGGVTFDVQSLR